MEVVSPLYRRRVAQYHCVRAHLPLTASVPKAVRWNHFPPLVPASYFTCHVSPRVDPLLLFCPTHFPYHPAHISMRTCHTTKTYIIMTSAQKAPKSPKRPKLFKKSRKRCFSALFWLVFFSNFYMRFMTISCHSYNPPPKRIQATNLTSSVRHLASFRTKLPADRYLSIGRRKPCFPLNFLCQNHSKS